LTAILEEMHGDGPTSRKPFVTIGYDEQPLDERAARAKPAQLRACTDGPDVLPEVSVTETRPGFETMAVIDEELLQEARTIGQAQQQQQFGEAEVLELFTFVILDRSLSAAATEEEKRDFVVRRLWHRLPPGGVDAIRRVDLRPADDTALMMRVWCAVPKVSR